MYFVDSLHFCEQNSCSFLAACSGGYLYEYGAQNRAPIETNNIFVFFNFVVKVKLTLSYDVFFNLASFSIAEISIHKETTLGEFKRNLEQEMGCSSEMFKVCGI